MRDAAAETGGDRVERSLGSRLRQLSIECAAEEWLRGGNLSETSTQLRPLDGRTTYDVLTRVRLLVMSSADEAVAVQAPQNWGCDHAPKPLWSSRLSTHFVTHRQLQCMRSEFLILERFDRHSEVTFFMVAIFVASCQNRNAKPKLHPLPGSSVGVLLLSSKPRGNDVFCVIGNVGELKDTAARC